MSNVYPYKKRKFTQKFNFKSYSAQICINLRFYKYSIIS